MFVVLQRFVRILFPSRSGLEQRAQAIRGAWQACFRGACIFSSRRRVVRLPGFTVLEHVSAVVEPFGLVVGGALGEPLERRGGVFPDTRSGAIQRAQIHHRLGMSGVRRNAIPVRSLTRVGAGSNAVLQKVAERILRIGMIALRGTLEQPERLRGVARDTATFQRQKAKRVFRVRVAATGPIDQRLERTRVSHCCASGDRLGCLCRQSRAREENDQRSSHGDEPLPGSARGSCVPEIAAKVRHGDASGRAGSLTMSTIQQRVTGFARVSRWNGIMRSLLRSLRLSGRVAAVRLAAKRRPLEARLMSLGLRHRGLRVVTRPGRHGPARPVPQTSMCVSSSRRTFRQRASNDPDQGASSDAGIGRVHCHTSRTLHARLLRATRPQRRR